MRLIKMLGLAAVGVAAVMAFVGASSAMATNTVLCKENVLVCPAEKQITGHVEGLAVNPELAGKFFGITGTIKCEHSVILGNALGLAAPLVVHIESIAFSGNCHLLAPFINEACTNVEPKALGLIDLLKTATNLGLATSLGSTVYVHCGSHIDCTLGGEPQFHALGSPSAGSLGALSSPTGGATVKNVSGVNCPEEGSQKWTASYSILLPMEAYISE